VQLRFSLLRTKLLKRIDQICHCCPSVFMFNSVGYCIGSACSNRKGKNITTLMGWAASLNRDEGLPKFWRTTFQSKNESALDPVKSRARPCLWRGKGHECLYCLLMLHPAAPGAVKLPLIALPSGVRYPAAVPNPIYHDRPEAERIA